MNHTQIIQALYVLLIGIAFLMEMMHRVDTDHVVKKLGLGCIVIGSLLHIAHKDNPLVPAGIAFYFGVILIRALSNRYTRRLSDRIENGKRSH